jgi:archaemetzincin
VVPRFTIVPIGTLPFGIAEDLVESLAAAFACSCELSEIALDPEPAYCRERGQYECTRLLRALEDLAESTGRRVLGVADVDLYSAIFAHVFGEARLGGRAGLFSLHRLRPSFYGLSEDRSTLLERARKEAIHESGHLLGLVHCRSPVCVMRFSGAAEEVDLKPAEFCTACRVALDSREDAEPHGVDGRFAPGKGGSASGDG